MTFTISFIHFFSPWVLAELGYAAGTALSSQEGVQHGPCSAGAHSQGGGGESLSRRKTGEHSKECVAVLDLCHVTVALEHSLTPTCSPAAAVIESPDKAS